MPSVSSSVFALAIVVAASLMSPPAEAQSSAAAQALFDEGLALRKAGKTAQACAKFEESLRLEATVGTRFNLADCFERMGKLASAWSQFLQVAADTERAGEAARAKAARTRAKALEPRLSKMVIKPAEPVEGMVVRRDGEEVGKAQWSTALPIDAGSHQLEATAPGKTPWSQTVTVRGEGQLLTINVPALADAPAGSPTPGPGAPMPGPGGTFDTPPPGGDTTTSSTPMILGITFGTLGLVGLGIGTGLGVVAIGKKGDVDELCPDLNNCTQQGIDTNDEAKTAATVSTVGFIAGGALLVTGIVLWVALPSSSATEAKLRITPNGVGLTGRF